MLKGLLTMSTNELKRIVIVQKIIDKNLTQIVAAQQLGLTDRQVRRLVKDYKLYGAEGLTSKKRGQTGNRKYTDEKIEDEGSWYNRSSWYVARH